MSHTESSLKNLAAALIGQIFGIIISFFTRIIFLRCLSEEYMGLNGLFTNILTIFSLVELGIGPAMNFSLYHPLAEKNVEYVKSLMALYKKAYILIGCAIAVIGLFFTPFYPHLMDKVPDIPRLTMIYWLFILNTVISYFFSYKRALIICDEKRYIATIYRYVFYIIMNFGQIILLWFTKSFILYLLIQILTTLLENIAISHKADQMYPFLREKSIKPLSSDTIRYIRKNTGAMLLHKIGGMVVQSTDNLLLSKFVGLVAVGCYSNYYLIIDALNKIISQFFSSIAASVGNLNALTSVENEMKLELAFDRMFFLNFWIYGFCSTCLWVLFNPFIELWLGSDMLFDQWTVSIIVINFYLTGMRKTVLTFKDSTGAFYYDRFKPLIEATINIIVSIVLVVRFGTMGVFLGTIVSTLCTSIWVEPYVLYKYVFHKNVLVYFFKFAVYTILTICMCFGTLCITNLLPGQSHWIHFICMMIVCVIIPNGIMILCYRNTKHFRFFVFLIKQIIQRMYTEIRGGVQ